MSLEVRIKKNLGSFVLDVEFENYDTQVLGILGSSGCGKSMTLKCIAGIEKPDEGRIVLDGRVLFDSEKGINLSPQKRGVGYLFQNYALFPNMTVRQNIMCGLFHEKDKKVCEEEYNRAVQLLGIADLSNLRPAQLSGGQQQRVALARILVNKPKLLMLDEPFSALDSYLREKLQFQMKSLLKEFFTDVLMVTHSRDEAYHMCDRIAVMDAGSVLTIKPTKTLFADPESIRAAVITGCKNIAGAKKISEYEVEVADWGIRLATQKPVSDDIKAVGIRAHYFNPASTSNAYEVEYTGEMEEPFESIIEFRFKNQNAASNAVWWRVPKDRKPQKFPEKLGVAPANVLLLYK